MNTKKILDFVFFSTQEDFIDKIKTIQSYEADLVYSNLQNYISFVIENNLSNSVTLTNLNIFYNLFSIKQENDQLSSLFVKTLLDKRNILFFKNSKNAQVFGKLKEDIYNFIIDNNSAIEIKNIFTEKVVLDIIINKLSIKNKKNLYH